MGRLWNLLFGWEEVLVTPDINQYMKMKNELENKGIRTQSEFINHASSHRGIGTLNNVGMYYLYVKREKAQ